jgi:transposase
MIDKQDLHERLVIGQKRDGRREYDEAAREELVQHCLQPGVSIARTAMEYGINPNLLRSWITRYQRSQKTASLPAACVHDDVIDMPALTPAFIPVVAAPPQSVAAEARLSLSLGVRLPNGVELQLGEAGPDEVATLLQMLGRLPCSGSTKG